MLIRQKSTSLNNYNPSTSKSQCHAIKLFAIDRVEKNEGCFLLNLLILQRDQE